MFAMPVGIRALGARERSRPLGPSAVCQSRRSETAEFRKQTVKLVKPKQMLLPLPNAESAVMVESDGSRVVDVAVAACCGLLVRLLIEDPLDPGYIAEPGVFP